MKSRQQAAWAVLISALCLLAGVTLYVGNPGFYGFGKNITGDTTVPESATARNHAAAVARTHSKSIAYVGANACKGCHEQTFHEWQQSDHYRAMQLASEESVLGDFSGVTVDFHGLKSRFYSKGAQFFTETSGPNNKKETFAIKYTFGFYPLQQYLVELSNGHIQALNIAWDSRDKKVGGQRWFHLRPDENMNAEHPFFWTRHFQNWNSRCAECHTTNFRKNYQPETHSYASRWSEINVACEACHGPAAKHVELAAAISLSRRNTGFTRIADTPLQWEFKPGAAIASPLGSKGEGDVNTCGRCHSLRSQLSAEQGDGFHDQYRLQLLGSGSYFDDGQILEEVFVLGSFLQSKMHAQGVSCSNCHNPHTGKILLQGNALCAQCHSAAVFDSPAHHHHPVNSDGAVCINCHMPARTYMQVDDRRDHSFTIPRPDLAEELGVPNACVNCHASETGKDNQWAAGVLQGWGIPATPSDHWARVNHRIRLGDSQVLPRITELVESDSPAAIIRASLLEQLVNSPTPESVNAAKNALRDERPMVRRAAASSLESVPAELRWQVLSSYLGDSNRSVRTEVARVLADLMSQLPPNKRGGLADAIQEYRSTLSLNADSPMALMSLGNLESRLGNHKATELAYKKALEIEPNFVPALVNLAEHYRNTSREKEVEPLLQKALQLGPDSGVVQHAYGLHLIREKEYSNALQHLELAVLATDTQPRFAYVYAVALESNAQMDKAIGVLSKAVERWPNQYDLLMLLTGYLDKNGESKRVGKYLAALSAIAPSDPAVIRLQQKYASQ